MPGLGPLDKRQGDLHRHPMSEKVRKKKTCKGGHLNDTVGATWGIGGRLIGYPAQKGNAQSLDNHENAHGEMEEGAFNERGLSVRTLELA